MVVPKADRHKRDVSQARPICEPPGCLASSGSRVTWHLAVLGKALVGVLVQGERVWAQEVQGTLFSVFSQTLNQIQMYR